MSFDNRIFNVNGKTREDLQLAMQLAFSISGSNTKAKHWRYMPEKGLVFLWTDTQNSIKLPMPIDHTQAAEIAFQWLKSDEAKRVPCIDNDADLDHDGDNSLGWRVYLEDWGHVGDECYAICCVKPVFLWHGK